MHTHRRPWMGETRSWPSATRLPLLVSILLLSSLAWPHAGHDHAAGPAPTLPLDPRAESHSDTIEMVLVLEGTSLQIYLDDFATNEPIIGAQVRVEQTTAAGPREDLAAPDTAGLYRLEAPWLAEPGQHDLMVSVQDERRFDLLTARLEVQPPDAAPAPPRILALQPHWATLGVLLLVFILGLATGGLLGRRRPRTRATRQPDQTSVASGAADGLARPSSVGVHP